MEKISIGLVEEVGATGILVGVLGLLLVLFVVGFYGSFWLLLQWGLLLSFDIFERTLMNMFRVSFSFPVIRFIFLLFIQFSLVYLVILYVLLRLVNFVSFE